MEALRVKGEECKDEEARYAHCIMTARQQDPGCGPEGCSLTGGLRYPRPTTRCSLSLEGGAE